MSPIVGRRVVYTSIACISASALYYKITTPSATSTLPVQKMLPTYQATFSVPLSCDSCVNDISTALSGLPGKLPFLPSPHPFPALIQNHTVFNNRSLASPSFLHSIL